MIVTSLGEDKNTDQVLYFSFDWHSVCSIQINICRTCVSDITLISANEKCFTFLKTREISTSY